MAQALTDLAQAAIDALALFNAERDRQQTAWAMSKFGKAFRGNGPCISDEQQEALLTQIVHYDDDAAGTLAEIQFQNEPRERDLLQWPLPTDEEFDFATSRGLTA